MFKKLILIGRPAAGKSEFIDFLKKRPVSKRRARYHIGEMTELDDFLWLWNKFVEDDLWEAAGQKRLFSKREPHNYLVTDGRVLDFCLEKFNHDIDLVRADGTTFIEFSRGKADGGYTKALHQLSDNVLKNSAILFLWNTYEESCRRNLARFIEKQKHSVLAHKVPDADMIRFGKEIDWPELTQEKPAGLLNIRGLKIPFVTMNNMPELTDENELDHRYKNALDKLMGHYKEAWL